METHLPQLGEFYRSVAKIASRFETQMKSSPRDSKRSVLANLLRLMLLTLIFIIKPTVAQADAQTKMGLESVADSIGFLAAAVAFAGTVVAVAFYLVFKSRRQD